MDGEHLLVGDTHDEGGHTGVPRPTNLTLSSPSPHAALISLAAGAASLRSRPGKDRGMKVKMILPAAAMPMDWMACRRFTGWNLPCRGGNDTGPGGAKSNRSDERLLRHERARARTAPSAREGLAAFRRLSRFSRCIHATFIRPWHERISVFSS